jgi:V8-like Glu-specific endopeptidase
VSICLLDPLPAGIEPLRVAPKPPREGSAITLMGHPLGQPLQVSMGGHLLDRDDRRLHYTTASAPGSSGSPVFNDAWEVVGMHHAGGLNMPRLHGQPGTYVANEGIAIQAIIRALKDR